MKRQKRLAWGIIIALFVLVIGCTVYASRISKPDDVRGRISVHAGDLVHVADTDGYDYIENSNPSHVWKFYTLTGQASLWSNEDQTGVTMRTSSAYNMYDVDSIEIYVNTQTNEEHKFAFYADTDKQTTYHTVDDKKISVDIPSDYEDENAYLFTTICVANNGLNVEAKIHIFNYGYGLYLDSEKGTIERGPISLVLKEHKVGVLDPEQLYYYDKDGNYTKYNVISSCTLKLADSSEATNNTTGVVYRDENMVFSYNNNNPSGVKLTGYNIVEMKENGTAGKVLYTITADNQNNASSGSVSTTIEFSEELMRTIEETSGRDLTDFYVQPVFERTAVEIAVTENVATTEAVKVTKINTVSGNYDQYDVIDTSNNQSIGILKILKNSHIRDYLKVDFQENTAYTGTYELSHFIMKYADAPNQLNTAESVTFSPSGGIDYNQKVNNRYVSIQAYIKGTVEIYAIEDTFTYDNSHHALMVGVNYGIQPWYHYT